MKSEKVLETDLGSNFGSDTSKLWVCGQINFFLFLSPYFQKQG